MNRPDELDRALASVRAGTQQPHQVIVSDDGDGSAELVASRHGAVYQRGPARGLGANRNACIRAASGDAIAFIDDDVEVNADFVAVATRVARAGTIVTGYEINHSSDPPRRVTPHNADFLGFQHVPPRGALQAIVINSAVFPAELFQQAHFDEHIKYGYEEIDITRHALSLGFAVAAAREMGVHHYPSALNRDGYRVVADAARLYLTFRAYLEYDRRPLKAATFAAFGTVHHLAHATKTAKRPAGMRTVRMAYGYWRRHRRANH